MNTQLVQEPTETIDFSVFQQVDIRVGVVVSAEIAEGIRASAYKLTVDFGELGIRQSISQAMHYPKEELIGKQVLAVVNLKPRQVGKHRSEVLVLGVPTSDQSMALIAPDKPASVGGRLY